MLTRRIQALAALALVDLMLDAADRKLREAQEHPRLDLSDIHAHRCPDCRYLWKHARPEGVSSEVYARAHHCPQCGTGPHRYRESRYDFPVLAEWDAIPYIEVKL